MTGKHRLGGDEKPRDRGGTLQRGATTVLIHVSKDGKPHDPGRQHEAAIRGRLPSNCVAEFNTGMILGLVFIGAARAYFLWQA